MSMSVADAKRILRGQTVYTTRIDQFHYQQSHVNVTDAVDALLAFVDELELLLRTRTHGKPR